jgi:ATP phosphoribosyltransferase
MLKPDDVPTYVEHGADRRGRRGPRRGSWSAARPSTSPSTSGLGRCRMVVAAPADAAAARPGAPLRVATKYPRIAAHYAARARTSR